MKGRSKRRLFAIAGIAVAGCLVSAVLGWFAIRSKWGHGPFSRDQEALERQDTWQAYGGTWQFVDGLIRNSSNERGAKLMNGSTSWKNYIVQADVLLLGAYGFAGLTVRATDEEEGVDAYHGYTAGVSGIDNALFLGRADYGWRGYRTKSISSGVHEGTWYHLKLLAYDCIIAVSTTNPSNETVSTSVMDPSCIRSGRFGLKSFNAGAEWKNIEVRSASQSDLVDMIGNTQPPLAVAQQSPAGADATTNDRFLEPIHRDLLQYRADTSAQPISSLRLLSPNEPQPVTVHGVVTLTSPILFVQDSTGGVAVTGHARDVFLEIGDQIEVKGDAELHDFSFTLHNAKIRLLWSHTPVPPISVTALQASTGAFDGEFVDILGHLVETRAGSDGTTTLTLSDGGQSFVALASRTANTNSFSKLKLMSRLRLRGICVADQQFTHNVTPFAILLPSFNDIEVVEGPPWWSARHIIALVSVSLLAGLASLIAYFLIAQWRLQAVLEERERLAHEMHDTIAQSFAGLGFQLEAICNEVEPESAILSKLTLARNMVRDSHQEARNNIAALRPETLESMGLLNALEACANRLIEGSWSICVRTMISGDERALPLRVADTLLRIGSEAIANAVRHAHPTTIMISLAYQKTAAELKVEDDGSGFTFSSESAGFGIRGMEKRADSIYAKLTIKSVPGQGTAVQVVVPLPPGFLRAYWESLAGQFPWKRGLNEDRES